MPDGIIVFGANGSGKTTLGRELVHALNIKLMDAEDYYFKESEIPYTKPRKKTEAIKLMLDDIEKYGSFVISAVTGDFGEEITSMYRLAVFLTAPLDVRIERIKHRGEKQYGKRVLIGGDMYEQEQSFIEFVKTRNLSNIEKWAKTIKCSILQLDGTNLTSQNIQIITEKYLSVLLDK